MIYKIVYVFLLGFVYEFLYITWMYFCNQKRSILASCFSVMLTSSGLFSLFTVVREVTLAIPYLTGVFIGSWVTIESHARVNALLQRLAPLRDRNGVQ